MATLVRCDYCRRETRDDGPGLTGWWRLEYAGSFVRLGGIETRAPFQFCSMRCLSGWSAEHLTRTIEVRPAGEGGVRWQPTP